MNPQASELCSALYVGVGVGTYSDAAFAPLPQAIPEAQEIGEILKGYRYDVHVIEDPDTAKTLTELRAKLSKDVLGRGGSLFVLWSGHGEPTPEGKLNLIIRDSKPGETPWFTAEQLAGLAARTGAGQILLILDTCYSGQAAIPALDIADRVIRELPPEACRVWIGVIASTMDLQRARDGVFGNCLVKLLKEGPADPALRLRWSAHSAGVRGDDVIDALVKELGHPDQKPKPASVGDPWVMLPNPRYDPSAPEQVIEHLLLAARGAERGEEGSYFTGRYAALNSIVSWMRTGKPGVFVVTGPAGSGKSAVLGRVVGLSNATERPHLLVEGRLEHADPGEGSVHAHVHARSIALEQFVELIDEQLIRRGVIPSQPAGPRNRGELQGAIERSGMCPVIAVDGVDEAGSESWRIASDGIRVLAEVSQVLVSTRDLPARLGSLSLVETLCPRGIIDLGDEICQEDARTNVRRYVVKRMDAIEAPAMDASKVADAIVRLADQQHEGLFLIARVITTQLRAHPIDTALAGWEDQLSFSIESAFDRDLSQIPPMQQGSLELPNAARELLTALAWGYGGGLSDDVWPLVATALSPTETTYNRRDAFWVLTTAGRYVVEDGEGGQVVYRLSHQRLVEHVRPDTGTARGLEGDEEHAGKVAHALIRYYATLLEADQAPQSHAYLWRYAWKHCADAGWGGIEILRRLAEHDEVAFRPDLAMALTTVGINYSTVGQTGEAVAAAEGAVALYRELADTSPVFRANLAFTLDKLGMCYRDAGRHKDAVPPAEEAVLLYRALAARNSVFRADLAGALSTLGVHYAAVGRRQDAVSPTEQAVLLYRDLIASNTAYRADLAMALSNLGIRYHGVGRASDAVAPTEEAEALYRELAATNPVFRKDLAMTLNNLSNRYSGVGRRVDAVVPVEEAVVLRRELATSNPISRRDLAGALNNLGIRYKEIGRRQDSVAATEEAVAICRELVAGNAMFKVDLARSLGNLAVSYSQVGKLQESVAPNEESCALYRELAASNSGLVSELALALNNLSASYGEVGRPKDALDPIEEAVELYRDLAAGNSAFFGDLARSLTNLGKRYRAVGRLQDGVIPLEEAVARYRDLVAANPAFRPNLANALNDLGICYCEVKRFQDAARPAEEAVAVLRDLCITNQVFRPDLANALNSLGNCYMQIGRPIEAVGPTEEAVALSRKLTANDQAFNPLLASALTNLGTRYSEVGRHNDAIRPAEEAVTLYRRLAQGNPGFRPKLAGALNNLGVRYSDIGRVQESVAPVEEALVLYRDLVAGNPAYVENLVSALHNLGLRYHSVGRLDEIDAAWGAAIASLANAADQAFLLLRRAAARKPDDQGATDDLLAALSLLSDKDGHLIAAHHDICRTRRVHNPDAFDARWRAQSGRDLPPWLLDQ